MLICQVKDQYDLERNEYTKSLITYNICTCDFPQLHSHTYWEFTIITKGSIENHIDGQKIMLNVGDIALLRPSDTHRLLFTKTKTVEYLNFVVDVSLMNNLITCSGIDKNYFEGTKPLMFKVSQNVINEILNSILFLQKETLTQYKNLRKHSILLKLFRQLQNYLLLVPNSLGSKNTGIITKINQFLTYESNLEYINVNTLSSQMNIHRVTLNRMLKNELGITIHEYINRFKLNYAQQLLMTTDLSITEISSRAGFYSLSNFIKSFSKQYGSTPAKFKNINKT